MNVVVLIPSLNPDKTLLQVVAGIRAAGFTRFLLVDDGSRPECRGIFDELERDGCAVVRHAVNLGKGRALKTGFNYVMNEMGDADGVVTCDADGQHEPEAIRAAAEAMLRRPHAVVLGVRKFFEARVPLSNLLGNTITRLVFLLLTGLAFGDTQCGLRAFPMRSLPAMMAVAGERFEYENVMLLAFRKNQQDYVELPMRAVYQSTEEGRVSHFNKALDPLRIYSRLIGFAAAPILTGLFAFWFYGVLLPCAPWLAALIAAAVGWAALWLATPAKRSWAAALATLLLSAVGAALVWAFTGLLALPPAGAWWLMEVLCGPLGYALWLQARFGRRPRRTCLSV